MIICSECGSGNIKLMGIYTTVNRINRYKVCGKEFVLDPEKSCFRGNNVFNQKAIGAL